MIIKYNPKLKSTARKLRKESTKAEIYLWNELKNKKMMGYGFKREKPIGEYIVDFYSPDLKFVIKIDGITHDYKMESDKARQKYLESLSLKVIRFKDSDVNHNLEGVINSLKGLIEKKQR